MIQNSMSQNFQTIRNKSKIARMINRRFSIVEYSIESSNTSVLRYGTGCWSGMDQVGAPTWGSAPLHPSYKRVASSASSPIPILSIACALRGPHVVRGKPESLLKARPLRPSWTWNFSNSNFHFYFCIVFRVCFFVFVFFI